MTGVLTLAVPALADPPRSRESGEHSGKQKKYESGDDHGNYKRDKRKRHESFNDNDRVLIHDYYARHPSNVPPGLAKKGGVPPGLAKKGGKPPGLERGEVLTAERRQHLLPLPPDLERLLPPPPHEVARMILDHHMVLVHKQTHKVLDVLHDVLP